MCNLCSFVPLVVLTIVLTCRQMLDLKENIENEVHATYDEYLKMEAHIKLYITEMEQAI